MRRKQAKKNRTIFSVRRSLRLNIRICELVKKELDACHLIHNLGVDKDKDEFIRINSCFASKLGNWVFILSSFLVEDMNISIWHTFLCIFVPLETSKNMCLKTSYLTCYQNFLSREYYTWNILCRKINESV